MRAAFFVAFLVPGALVTACGPTPDRCDGFACDQTRICVDLATGPSCVCPDETAAPDGGPCVEVGDDGPEDAGMP